jgi:hypothetical protein
MLIVGTQPEARAIGSYALKVLSRESPSPCKSNQGMTGDEDDERDRDDEPGREAGKVAPRHCAAEANAATLTCWLFRERQRHKQRSRAANDD